MHSRSLHIALLGATASFLAACGARTELENHQIIPADAGPLDAGCPSMSCPVSQHFDPVSCACVADACPNDAAQTILATISADFAEGTAITVTGGEVYWTTRAGKSDSDGVVSKVSRCGGNVTTLASGQIGPVSIAVNATKIFFGTLGDDNSGVSKGAIQSIPIEGGAPTTIQSGSFYEGGITASDDYVYWTNLGSLAAGVWRAPSAGGAPVGIAPDQVFNFIAVDSSRVFVSQPATIPANSRLTTLPLAGGDLTVIVPTGVGEPGIIAIDDTSVYYVTGDSNLKRIPKAGGASTVLANGQVNEIALDTYNLYWSQGDATSGVPGAIKSVPKSGGAVTTILSGDMQPEAIAVDDTYVYWLNGGDLYRLPK